jgi:hypothetical protein
VDRAVIWIAARQNVRNTAVGDYAVL